jgi:carbonic anhydrase
MAGRLSHAGLVVCCLDYRYVAATLRWAKQQQGLTIVDLKTDAGGVKAFLSEGSDVSRWMLKNVRLASQRHGITTVLLVNHQDCAAYGGSVEGVQGPGS